MYLMGSRSKKVNKIISTFESEGRRFAESRFKGFGKKKGKTRNLWSRSKWKLESGF